MEPVGSNLNTIKLASYFSTGNKTKSAETEKSTEITDSAEISNTSKAFKKLDDFLNLGKSGRMDISDLNPKEKEEFLKMLSTLIKKGVVGYEILEVNGKPEKHYIDLEIGDQRIKGAKLYKKTYPDENK